MIAGAISPADPVLEFLCRQVVYSSILFICILPVYLAISRKHLYWLYYLWVPVLARLVVPPDLGFPFSLRAGVEYIGKKADTAAPLATTDAGTVPAFELLDAGTATTLQSVEPLTPVLVALWFTGAVFVAARYGRMLALRQRILRDARPVRDNKVGQMLEGWQKIHGVRRRIHLLKGAHNSAPFTAGLFKPVIYIPGRFLKPGCEEALNAGIGHEVVHIKRMDDLWVQLQWFLKIVYFFHPVVWFCCQRIDRHREQICDYETVTNGRITSRSYINGLIETSTGDTCEHAVHPSFGRQYKLIVERINLLKESTRMYKQHRKSAAFAIALSAVFVLPMASLSATSVSNHNNLSSVLENLVAPIKEGRISSPYGVGTMPIGSEKGKERFHRGVDIAARANTPVFAVFDGIVESAVEDFENSDNPSYGKHIQIRHGTDIHSVYTHLNRTLVSSGQRISAGQKIGSVGETGRATGPHLHMELYVDRIAVDPERYITFAF